MQKNTCETKKKVIKLQIQEGHTIASLAAEYGVCNAIISNWVRVFHEKCQINDAAKSEYELIQEVHKLQQDLAEAKRYSLKRKSISGVSIY